jgi:hypothetical protein
MAPVVRVSCAATLRDIMAGVGTRVFVPDSKSRDMPNSKAYFLGFCITLKKDHFFYTVAGMQQMEPTGDYQVVFHWHEGEGRLTGHQSGQMILITRPFPRDVMLRMQMIRQVTSLQYAKKEERSLHRKISRVKVINQPSQNRD